MLTRVIFLLAPVYVCLFWAIVLAGNRKKYSTSRNFLGRFMLFPLAIYFTHFLYFTPLPDIFPYFDALFAYTSLLGFPMYYVYFRLLTVDEKFSLKAHGKYFIVAILVGTLYSVGVLLAPKAEYRVWLYNQTAYANSPQIIFLAAMRILGKITYLVQVIVTVIGNHILINKYSSKAEQYYSDIQDGKNNNARILNYSIIVLSITALFFGALGRYSLRHFDIYICIGWTIFSVVLFIIGYMGFKQKPINPTFESLYNNNEQSQAVEIPEGVQKKLLHKLLLEFEHRKIFLNNQLNIMDVVDAVGTNRTYISTIINQKYNQNFCSFVNNFRILELEKTLQENPEMQNEELSDKCGFGSVNSMKRAVSSKTGLSFAKWKDEIQNRIKFHSN